MLRRRYGKRIIGFLLIGILIFFLVRHFIEVKNFDCEFLKCRQVNMSYDEIETMYESGILEKILIERADFQGKPFNIGRGTGFTHLDRVYASLVSRLEELKDGEAVTLCLWGTTVIPMERHFIIPVFVYKLGSDKVYTVADKEVTVKKVFNTERKKEIKKMEMSQSTYRTNYVFAGWYYYENGDEIYFDVNTPINRNYDLHAKWYEETSLEGILRKNITHETERIERKLVGEEIQTCVIETQYVTESEPVNPEKDVMIKSVGAAYLSITTILIVVLGFLIVRDIKILIICQRTVKKAKEEYFRKFWEGDSK